MRLNWETDKFSNHLQEQSYNFVLTRKQEQSYNFVLTRKPLI